MKSEDIEVEIRKVAKPGETVFLQVLHDITEEEIQVLVGHTQDVKDRFGVNIIVLDMNWNVLIGAPIDGGGTSE